VELGGDKWGVGNGRQRKDVWDCPSARKPDDWADHRFRSCCSVDRWRRKPFPILVSS
jgi:hypothetical protein